MQDVQRLLAIHEIEGLIYAYAQRLDAGDLAGVAELFSRGRLATGPDATDEHAVVGREGVLGQYEAATRLHPDGTPRTKHLTTNVAIDVEHRGGTARARSYYTVLQQVDDLPLQAIISGSYDDTFHHLDGSWWFDTRIIHVDLVGDLSKHLLFELE